MLLSARRPSETMKLHKSKANNLTQQQPRSGRFETKSSEKSFPEWRWQNLRFHAKTARRPTSRHSAANDMAIFLFNSLRTASFSSKEAFSDIGAIQTLSFQRDLWSTFLLQRSSDLAEHFKKCGTYKYHLC